VLAGAANLVGVLVAAALLGVDVWVVAIVSLGYVLTRPALGALAVGRAVLALAVSAVAYVAVVVAIAVLLPR
jgi:hypothetical protein